MTATGDNRAGAEAALLAPLTRYKLNLLPSPAFSLLSPRSSALSAFPAGTTRRDYLELFLGPVSPQFLRGEAYRKPHEVRERKSHTDQSSTLSQFTYSNFRLQAPLPSLSAA